MEMFRRVLPLLRQHCCTNATVSRPGRCLQLSQALLGDDDSSLRYGAPGSVLAAYGKVTTRFPARVSQHATGDVRVIADGNIEIRHVCLDSEYNVVLGLHKRVMMERSGVVLNGVNPRP
jgi:hypothetical protein